MSGPAEYATKKQRGRPFRPGQSGNPRGKPRGARNKATLAAEALLDGEAAALTRQAVALAMAGDVAALRLCLERILPPRRSRPVTIELPDITTPADLTEAMARIVAAVASGELTPDEAAPLASLLEAHRRMMGGTNDETLLDPDPDV